MYQLQTNQKKNIWTGSGQNLKLQPKLKIGQPGDKYEQEADAVADRVMMMSQSETMQMQPAGEEEEPLQPKLRMQAIEDEEEMLLPKSDLGGSFASPEIHQQINSSKGNGRSLIPETNHFMSNAFGSDFSGVKVHTDSNAVEMNQQLNARAFTYGNNIYFNKGQFNPASLTGKRLLSHELTHVVQQQGETSAYKSPSLGIRNSLRGIQTKSKMIQRAVSTWGGDWDTTQYKLRADKDGSGNAYPAATGVRGLDINLKFTPNANVNAELIGLSQTANSIVNNSPSAINATVSGRSISSADAVTKGGQSDEGAHIDRASAYNNPIYPVNTQPSASLDDTSVSAGWGQLGWNDSSKVPAKKDATLIDQPTLFNAEKNSAQLFETTAIATKGAQAGTYYGSVKWGWRTDAAKNHTIITLDKVSEGTPSSTFMKSAGLWNASKDSTGKNTVDLPVEDVQLISNPAGVDIGLGPVYTHLPVGTRVVIMPGFPSMIESFIRVVDGSFTGETGKVKNSDMTDERS